MRLIDADALKQTFCAECDRSIKCEDCDIDYHFEHLAPTVDIDAITGSHERIGYDRGFRDGYAQATSEVRHGHWTDNGHIGKRRWCSVCGGIAFEQYDDYGLAEVTESDYCPHCGAKMDEVEDGKI